MKQAVSVAPITAMLAAGLMLSGCAMMGPVVQIPSAPSELTFESIPDSAEVVVNGAVMGRTPLRLVLTPDQRYLVTYRKEGCKDLTAPLDVRRGTGWVILDVLDVTDPRVAPGGYEFRDTNLVGRLECQPEEVPVDDAIDPALP